ncbi:MAG: PaaI family thioesterase [Rhodospirillales bacterium]|nr:PaaI family thioesterase [Rhodospirillales bacterium]
MPHRGPWTDRQTGVVPPEIMGKLSGVEYIRRMIAGDLPMAPICAPLRFTAIEVEPGRVLFEGAPGPDFFNPGGNIHGGYHATLLDSAMTMAVFSMLRAGQGVTTLEFKISFVRPLTDRVGHVLAEGKAIQVGRTIGTAEGRLTDKQGKLYAHATTTCAVLNRGE